MGSYKYRVISRVTIVMTHIRGLINPLITTHEPPSSEGPSHNTGSLLLRTLCQLEPELGELFPSLLSFRLKP